MSDSLIYICYAHITVSVLTQLIGFLAGNEDSYLNITLSMISDRSLSGSGNQEWWDIAIAGCGSSCGVLPMVIFNDKVSPPSLGFLAGYGQGAQTHTHLHGLFSHVSYFW